MIIGFGTSAPELIVSAIAAAGDEPDVAIGNIVGSNVAHLSLLLGLGAALVPLVVVSRTVRREAPIVVAAVVLLAVVVQGEGISRVEGMVLLAAMIASLALVMRKPPGDPLEAEVVELAEPSTHHVGRESGRTIVGLIATPLGADRRGKTRQALGPGRIPWENGVCARPRIPG